MWSQTIEYIGVQTLKAMSHFRNMVLLCKKEAVDL